MDEFNSLMPKITISMDEDEIIDSVISVDCNENDIFVKPTSDLKILNVKQSNKSPSPIVVNITPPTSPVLVKKKRNYSHLKKARDASNISRKAGAEVLKEKRRLEKVEKDKLKEIKRQERSEINRENAKQRYRMRREVDLEIKAEKEIEKQRKTKEKKEVDKIKQVINSEKEASKSSLSYTDFSMYMTQYKRESKILKEQFKPIKQHPQTTLPPIVKPKPLHPPNYYNPNRMRRINPDTLF